MEEDLQRVAIATGASVRTIVNNVIPDVLGQCELFEERQVGNERFNIFTGCPGGATATIVLCGDADQVREELKADAVAVNVEGHVDRVRPQHQQFASQLIL